METYLVALRDIGLEHIIYVTVDAAFDKPHVWTNLDIYTDSAPPSEDPFLRYLCNAYAPTLTGVEFMHRYDYLEDSEEGFIKSAAGQGFTSGIAIPVRLRGSRRFGGFNYGTTMAARKFETWVADIASPLFTASLLVHRRLEEIFKSRQRQSGRFRELGVAPVLEDLTERVDDLTDREQEVLFLLAQGFARKEIAHLCGISPNTVGGYIKDIYRKMGVRNRAEATRIATTIGFTPPGLQAAQGR